MVELFKLATDAASEYYTELSKAAALKEEHFGGSFDLDYTNLAETGWGVVYPETMKPGVKEAIQPQVDLRKEQAGALWKETVRKDGESVRDFLSRYKAPISGEVDTELMPYYLMIVGGPDEISFEFQYELDEQYGVGRVCFDDVEGYAKYAESVIRAEKGEMKRGKKVAFFGAANADDPPTQSSAKFLVEPLVEEVKTNKKGKFRETWELEVVLREAATREKLGKLMGGEETPALLFTATHGAGGKVSSEAAQKKQGMLVCQDFPRPKEFAKMPAAEQAELLRKCCLAADDLDEASNVAGTVAMLFACYGAGTPQRNILFDADTAVAKIRPGGQAPVDVLAEKPFVSSLAKRLLSHPNGGALAVFGHVDRSLDYAFQNPGDKSSSHIKSFEGAVRKLLLGFPVGYATEGFNSKHAELGNRLGDQIWEVRTMTKPAIGMVQQVFELHDARTFILLGDPAVKLAV
ncbi:MAG: hypothetical protein FJW36_20580 [Acidobacteria bacterium]|nr:hypothetical protein [Acidobacteriota bacterium]